jgi:hypothetical protein
MGNISGIISAGGEYSALYNGKGRPRYWERFAPPEPPPAETEPALEDAEAPTEAPAPDWGHFSFQWDEEGRITRFTGIYSEPSPPDTPEDSGVETDIRYEYILDEQGNWIERRATPMVYRAGFLVPGTVEQIFRRVEYPVF